MQQIRVAGLQKLLAPVFMLFDYMEFNVEVYEESFEALRRDGFVSSPSPPVAD